MRKATITITHCSHCPHHELVDDPDPFDWFGSNDSAIICTHPDCVKTYQNDAAKEYDEHRGWHSPGQTRVAGRLGAFDVDKVRIPQYCPFLKNENNVE